MSVIERTPKIETRRLALRAPAFSDAPRVAALANDLGVARMTTRIPHPYSRGEAEGFLARMAALDYRREAVFAIEHEDDGVVGLIGMHPTGQFGPEIGYWLGRPWWGRGFATEAALALLSWIKQEKRARAVISGHFIDNPASGRVLQKAGFLYTGVIEPRYSTARDAVVDTRMMVWIA
ncbi:GNAT family N-acetyltransferase [Phenylobacterium montanum]|uniref:GNAT family N-acetyltransferase n=1 Tax=Phenylobacterium montanum TaxID=2823693 RepID=A0A975FW93_9CAUL|nr:GNAT family N-acetyltransferase [Caulobacter sp. S6]QUD86555.1 GNAT family N-acetyltransferase [Caulobacter sp. S6]